MTPACLFTIREVAKRCDVTFRALRFYEVKGLIKPNREGFRRRYSEQDCHRVETIAFWAGAGFSLAEIGELLELRDAGVDIVERIRSRLTELEAELEGRGVAIARLRKAVSHPAEPEEHP